MSKKKANNEGSIVKRTDGRYMGRYTLNGKRYAVYGETFDDVRIKLAEKLVDISKGICSSPSLTVSQWLREWLEIYALPTIKQSSYISYIRSFQTFGNKGIVRCAFLDFGDRATISVVGIPRPLGIS